jgi:serine/threonine protein kinase/hemoglobin-like flavoprotein/class 3 adenylate cyclase
MSALHQVGKYRLVDQIGRGAMGEVFRAHDSVLDRYVALKIIEAGDEEKRLRFRREAQSAARLAHPNIVVVHDFGEDSGRFFMAMELLDGSDLKRLIRENTFADLRSKLDVMEQICDAVAFAHATNIIHRDLKPANIFVLPSGQVKIVDFGLARIGESSVTGTGTILGTPHYMAPEQVRGRGVDARADLFSLGAVFYELLSGRRAFEGDTIHAVLYAVMQRDPDPLHLVMPSVPAAVSEVVMRALQKDPARRFRSAEEMRNVVRALRARGSVPQNVALNDIMRELTTDTLHTRRDSIVPTSTSHTAIVRESAQPATATFVGEAGGDVTVDAGSGRTLLESALAAGIPHTHECGGNARCSTCRVAVLSGSINLSPRDSAELKLAQRFGFGDDVRLACQTKVNGPVKVRRLIVDSLDVQIMRGTEKPSLGAELPLAVLSARARELPALLRRGLPYDVIHILNRYYLQIGEAVLANGGTLEPPSGPAITAFFGINGDDARTKCTNAVRAALRMRQRMEPLNTYLSEHFGVSLTLDIGLHYGRMISGSIGHPNHMRLTAVGEAASTAGALAVLNEFQHGSGILASEELINVVDQVSYGHVSHERVGDRELTVYEVLDFNKPDTHYLVQTSFEIVAARKDEAARIFYEHLFNIAPHTRRMFENVDIGVQGAMLMNMIGAAVKGLDRLDDLKPMLQELGRRHGAYGVRIEHYAAVEACLLYTIETIMGPQCTLDVKLAWMSIYNFIAQTMIEAQLAE